MGTRLCGEALPPGENENLSEIEVADGAESISIGVEWFTEFPVEDSGKSQA